jgi:hypothetical protein
MARNSSSRVRDVLDGEEVRDILRETFFAGPEGPDAPEPTTRKKLARNAKDRPAHYKVICISLYTEDLERLDGAVRELKRRGFTKANRSAVLRAAMEQIDLDRVRRGM